MIWPCHWGKAAPHSPRSSNSAQSTLWLSKPIPAQETRLLLRHSNTVRAIRPFHNYTCRYCFRLPSSVWFGHSNYNPYEPRSNLRRISGTTQLGRNGRTPGSSGPAGKAADRRATSSMANRGLARGAPSRAPIRRCPTNDRGRPGSEAPESAKTSSIEHIGRFTAQGGEADSNAQKLRLFVHSLTGAAFSWFINLPPNSMRDWSNMEKIFHEHFYQTNWEITIAELARMSQASDESPRDYLQRFKTCRNWCRTNLPEKEFVKMAEEGLEFENRKKFQGIEFRDMHDLINKVDRYASLLKE
ncbi:unnamed protein product [Prunus armeniaca]